MPILVAVHSKTYVCSLTAAEIATSNPAKGMDVCVVCFKYKQIGKMQGDQNKETSTD